MITKNFEWAVAIGRRPEHPLGRDLARGANHRRENFVESVEQPGTGNRLFFLRGEIKEARELLAGESRDRFVANDGDRHDLKTERLQLGERAGIVLDVSGLE
jgi:hypothetical protein